MKNKFLFIVVLVFALNFQKVYSYTNMYQPLYAHDFYSQGSATQVVGFVKIENNVLSVSFSISWPSQYQNIYYTPGPVSLGQNVPNDIYMYKYFTNGSGQGNSATSGYFICIANNQLQFRFYGGSPWFISYSECYFSKPLLPVWYRDADGDGFGDYFINIGSNTQPIGYVANNTDCDDTNALINPNTIWYADGDGDGYGNTTIVAVQCIKPAGTSINNIDCNDSNIAANVLKYWYDDSDNDTLGDPNLYIISCDAPLGYVANNTDLCPGVFGSYAGCIIPTPTTPTGSTNQNFILTSIPKIATGNLQGISTSDINTSITYFDGLGRPMEQISNRTSNSGNDIVIPIEYDALGRQKKEYLPYASTQSNIALINVATAISNSITQYQTNYGTANNNPFSEKQFESAPLSRILKQAAAGNDWKLGNGHEIKLDYQTNTATEVKQYNAIATWNPATVKFDVTLSVSTNNAGYYYTNQLYKTITKNENWISGNSNTTEEFKNKTGQVVLKRTYNGTTPHDTFYVFDQYDNLSFVIPPAVDTTKPVTQTVLDALCYQYIYDYRNRLIEKKIPGKQWEYIVYDKLDRIVATGPSFSPFVDIVAPSNIGWLITKYDIYNRPLYTGWQQATSITATDRSNLQATQNGLTSINESKTTTGTIDGVTVFYSNLIAPTSFKLLTVNYYDDYSFPAAPTTFPTIEGQTVFYDLTKKPKGLATGSWIRTLDKSFTTPIRSEQSYILYDYKARPIRNYSTNYLGGFTQVDTKLDFAGKTLYTVTTHKQLSGSALTTVKDEFDYTAQDRLLSHTHQINGRAFKEVINKNEYNELGQLIVKRVGSPIASTATVPSTFVGLQKVDYTYNIRGWLKTINDVTNLIQGTDPVDLFAFKINYNTLDNSQTGVKALYNGNIAETRWLTNFDNMTRSYGYSYDDLNRLTNAQFVRPTNPLFTNPNPADVKDTFNESMSYDKNGNIQSLIRNGGLESQTLVPTIDNLTYIYDTNEKNKLLKVTDAILGTDGFKDDVIGNGTNPTATDYSYDLNGNMTRDDNKQITSIIYNHLNLPTKINFSGTNRNIVYLYNAIGQKLTKLFTDGPLKSTTDYLSGFQYNNGTLQFFSTSEGYVKYTAGVPNPYDYVFNYTDHLGNIRLSYGADPANPSLLKKYEENNYYPFGMKHATYNNLLKTIVQADPVELIPSGKKASIKIDIIQIDPMQPNATIPNSGMTRRFNGKEFQDELGLNVFDYGNRNYDPATGRFFNVDRFSEKYVDTTPYHYTKNNPVFFVDIKGDSLAVFKPDGSFWKIEDDGKKEWSGRVYQKSKEKHDKKTNTNYTVYSNPLNFEFADPANDSKDIKNGTINKVLIVDEKKIGDMLGASGALDPKNKDSFSYINTESKGGGRLDFSYTSIPINFPGASANPLSYASPFLFLPKGERLAHNHMNFGNFLWSSAGTAMGFSMTTLSFAAHYNSVVNSGSNGYPGQLDSQDDQRSIIAGSNYSSEHQFSSRTWTSGTGISPIPQKK